MFKFLQRWKSPGLEAAGGSAPTEFATAEDIRACFRLLLGREPNPEECPGHSARAGEKLATVVRSFLHSKEFEERRLLEALDLEKYELRTVARLKLAAPPSHLGPGTPVLSRHHDPRLPSLLPPEN